MKIHYYPDEYHSENVSFEIDGIEVYVGSIRRVITRYSFCPSSINGVFLTQEMLSDLSKLLIKLNDKDTPLQA